MVIAGLLMVSSNTLVAGDQEMAHAAILLYPLNCSMTYTHLL